MRSDSRKASQKAWLKTPKGKAYQKRQNKRYRSSAKGKSSQKKADKLRQYSDKRKASQAAYRNSDKGKATRAAYRNSDNYRNDTRATNARRRARERDAPGFATAAQIQARFDYYGGRCYLKLDGCLGEGTTPEHVIPLSRGGSNWASNIRPACTPCNRKKWAN